MASHVLLDNINHKDLRIISKRSASLGDNIPSLVTFPFEYRDIQTNFPICFCKDPETGNFYTAALFGFEEGENLFLRANGWNARYIPIMVQRQPFSIGFQQIQGSSEKQQVITFNPAHPRVNKEVGEPVFNEHGGYTPYLEQVIKMLESIDTGHKQNELLIRALDKYDLLSVKSEIKKLYCNLFSITNDGE